MRESVDQILAAYRARGLQPRRSGPEWHGPCPSCGGRDRFWIGSDGRVGCRQCRDFRAIAAALRLNGIPPGALDTTAIDQALRETARRHADAARRAVAIFAACRPRRHQYLAAKGFRDTKAPVYRDRIVVPVWGPAGLQSIQFIGRSRKRFLSGGRMAGGRAVLGPCDPRGRWWHVEGLATGLSVRRALDALGVPDCVVICFSAAGLMVARDCRRALIVADHDASGAGQQWAERAGCPYWMPPEPGDANDFERASGTGALARCAAGSYVRCATVSTMNRPRNKSLRVDAVALARWKATTGLELDDLAAANSAVRMAASMHERRAELRADALADGMQWLLDLIQRGEVVPEEATITRKGMQIVVMNSEDAVADLMPDAEITYHGRTAKGVC